MTEEHVLYHLTLARGFAYLAALAATDPWGGLEMRGKGYLKRGIEEEMNR